MEILRRLRDIGLIGGVIAICVLAGYAQFRSDEVIVDQCVVQTVGGVEFTRCSSNGIARNTNTEPVRVYVGILYEDNEKEMYIGEFLLSAGKEQSASLFMQSDRYTIVVYDKTETRVLGLYSPKKNHRGIEERKIPT